MNNWINELLVVMKVDSALYLNLKRLNFSTLFTVDIEFYLGAQYLSGEGGGAVCSVHQCGLYPTHTVVTPALTSGDWHWPLSPPSTALLASTARLASTAHAPHSPGRRGWAWPLTGGCCLWLLSLSLTADHSPETERRSHNNPSIKRLKLNWRWLSVFISIWHLVC